MRKTILVLILAGSAMPALAQTPPTPPAEDRPMPPPRPGMLLRADLNGDGVITRAEAIAAADARFDRLDANHDGIVTRDEMRAARDAMRGGPNGAPPPPPASAGASASADAAAPPPPPGNGPMGRGLTREDSRARALAAFDHADANHDGVVDKAELAQLRDMRPGPRRGGDDMPPPPPGQD